MSTDTLHFRVGADAGILLMDIAQEHLLCRTDIDKALNVFNESFGGGCPENMQLKLLTGDMVIEVDEESQQFIVGDRKPHHENIFPKLDLPKFFVEKQKQMDEHLEDIEKGLNIIIKEFRFTKTYRVDFSIEAVIKYIYGNDEDMIAEIEDAYKLNQMRSIIRLAKEFIEKSMAIYELSKRVNVLYGLDISFDTYELFNLVQKIKNISNLNFIKFTEGQEDEVTAYLNATKVIDEVIEAGIKPVNIMDNYSAGWLAPNGDYYGLNGEIANMLHIQIADALSDAKIIPDIENGYEGNSWLEDNGWVKIHGNHILYEGYNLQKREIENVPMTDIQIKKLYEYGASCHGGALKIGFKMEMMSATRFKSIEPLMRGRLFAW